MIRDIEILVESCVSVDTIEDIIAIVENLFKDGQLIRCEKKRAKIKPYKVVSKDNIIKAGTYEEKEPITLKDEKKG